MLGVFAFMIYQGNKNFPAYAEKAVLHKQYSNLITDIETSINESDTALSLAAKLEKIALPEEVIYLTLEKVSDSNFDKDNKHIDIIKKFGDSGSKSTTIINGTGYGRINGDDIVIISQPIEKIATLESYLIYLKHEPKPE